MDAIEYAKSFCKDIKKYHWDIKLQKNISLNLDGNKQTAYMYVVTVLDNKRSNIKVEFTISFILGTDGNILQTILRDRSNNELEILSDAVAEQYLARRASAPMSREYFSTMRVGY